MALQPRVISYVVKAPNVVVGIIGAIVAPGVGEVVHYELSRDPIRRSRVSKRLTVGVDDRTLSVTGMKVDLFSIRADQFIRFRRTAPEGK